MTLTIIFFALWLFFFLAWALGRVRLSDIVEAATREHLIALAYIAQSDSWDISRFAALHLSGKHAERDRDFPDFMDFRAAEIERERDDAMEHIT